jgi:DNA repair protein RecN (Recombination protein N)
MLSELHITNFAIIDHLELTLAPKFNVITGETGAGKSIIIDAVNMLLGSRTDADFIRAGTDRAVVEGIFKLSQTLQREVRPLLDTEGIEQEAPDEVTLAREIRTNGRTVCRINGTTVGMGFFREVGGKLIDIHGQSEHLSLLRPKEHVNLLDRYANLMDLRASNVSLVRKLNEVRSEIDHLMQDEAALARRVDMLGFQIEEIRATAPRVGEEEELRDERTRLANAEQLATLSIEVRALLVDGRDDASSAVDLLAQAALLLGKLAKIDPALEEAHDIIEDIQIRADDLGRTIRSYGENIEFNPSRLNEVEERLEALARLKRKYGGTIEAVLEFSEKAQRELDSITHSEERLIELRAEEDKLLHQIGEIAFRLSNKRQKAAQVLGSGIENELQELRMGGARFEVQIVQTEDAHGCYVEGRRLAFDQTGVDQVEFMMSANPGEPLRAMAKVASGGEAARIMLALKSVLSRADQTPTLIFDEIDQGIGGRVGATVGRKLWGLSGDHQVLCVTHLAQLAGYGDIHFKVAKSVKSDRTTTMIRPLTDPERVIEIADMLGSESDSARQSALDILNIARNVKAGKPAKADMPDSPAKNGTGANGNGKHSGDQTDDGRPAPVQKSLL